jgi:hypothetical protein
MTTTYQDIHLKQVESYDYRPQRHCDERDDEIQHRHSRIRASEPSGYVST